MKFILILQRVPKGSGMKCVHLCIYLSLFLEVKLAEISPFGRMPPFSCEILEYLPSENNGKNKDPYELPEVSLTLVLYITIRSFTGLDIFF